MDLGNNIKSLIIKNSEIFDNKNTNSDLSVTTTASALLVQTAEYVELNDTKIYNNKSSNLSNVNLLDVKKVLFDKRG